MQPLPDIQQTTEGFPRIPIAKVGVRHVEVPLLFADGVVNKPVLVEFSAYCDLGEATKGINMSRMAQSLFNAALDLQGEPFEDMVHFAKVMQKAHASQHVYVKGAFRLFLGPHPIGKSTPITGFPIAEILPIVLETVIKGEEVTNFITITYTGMSLCPCSKEMSLLVTNLTEAERKVLGEMKAEIDDRHDTHTMDDYTSALESFLKKVEMAGFGAHNQKSHVELKVQLPRTSEGRGASSFTVRDLYRIALKSVSTEIFSMLKRPDEKYVTETSYLGGYFDAEGNYVAVPNAGPKFVEDISRQAAEFLTPLLDKQIDDFVIVVNNDESIHSNDIVATAVLTAGRGLR